MAEKAEEVVIQTSDIEFIRDVVSNLYYLSLSLDLQDQYRTLRDGGSTSSLTIQAEEALVKATAAAELALPSEDEVSPPEEPGEKPHNPIRDR